MRNQEESTVISDIPLPVLHSLLHYHHSHFSGTFASSGRFLLKHNIVLPFKFFLLVLTGDRLCDLILNINNNRTLDSLILVVLNQFTFFVSSYSSLKLLGAGLLQLKPFEIKRICKGRHGRWSRRHFHHFFGAAGKLTVKPTIFQDLIPRLDG